MMQSPGADSQRLTVWLNLELDPRLGQPTLIGFYGREVGLDDPNYTVLKSPRLGCVVVLTRSGGGHVTLYESTSGSNYMCRGGNQSDAINLAPFSKSNVVALVWPSVGPDHPTY